MQINTVEIEDTFAEAFKMWGSRLIITALNERWAMNAAQVATGFATSIIGCGCEAGIGGLLPSTRLRTVGPASSYYSSPCQKETWKNIFCCGWGSVS